MRHRALRGDFLDFQSDGIGFISTDPDWQHGIAIYMFEDNDRRAAVRVHHQSANLNFNFHADTSPNTSRDTASFLAKDTIQAIQFCLSDSDSYLPSRQ